MSKALKFDNGKPPLGLIPPHAELVEAEAFADGQRKYGMHNYQLGGLTAMQLLSAAKRHINGYIRGEQVAADSQVHHLGHARACLGMIIELEARGTLVDDRYKPVPVKLEFPPTVNEDTAKLKYSIWEDTENELVGYATNPTDANTLADTYEERTGLRCSVHKVPND